MTNPDQEYCDEIAGLARRHLEAPGQAGMRDIDAQITAAADEARWDDMNKWHRVKLRYIRFQQEGATRSESLSPAPHPRPSGP